MVARLRAECHRLGLVDISISSNQARLAPITLKVSETLRVRRLARDAIYKEDARQLVVPIKRGLDPAAFLVGFLRDVIPPADVLPPAEVVPPGTR
jgi:transcription-repair coupling factor (superfamily II helicase)